MRFSTINEQCRFLVDKDGVLLATNLHGESLATGVTAALAMEL